MADTFTPDAPQQPTEAAPATDGGINTAEMAPTDTAAAPAPVMFDSLPAADSKLPPPEVPVIQQAKTEMMFDDLPEPRGAGLDTPEATGHAFLHGVGQGFAGPAATAAEKYGAGIDPETIKALEEAHPIAKTLGEVAGFAGSLATGYGEAAILTKAGNAAAKLAGLGEASTIGAKLAKGAVAAAAEMATLQAGDETSKAILGDPSQTPGSVAAHMGLSALLGAAMGPVGVGIGEGAKAALDNPTIKEFIDRLAFRKANTDPNEAIKAEFQNVHNMYHEMGSEVGGVDGVKQQAMEKLMPEMNQGIADKGNELLTKMQSTAESLLKTGDKAGMVEQLNNQIQKLSDALNPGIDPLTQKASRQLDPVNIYNTMNGIKRQLGEWGKFNKDFVPLNEVAFRNASKSLGATLKEALEDEGTWGKVGKLQKSINEAWTSAIPAVKDVESKFMTKIGGVPVVDQAKFNTYINQNGKATSQTIRQNMMGKFVDSVDKFQKATADAYHAAGVENPFQPAGMSVLKESLDKPSTGAKLADLWYDKLSSESLGSGAGALAGEVVSPGLGGAYMGEKILGPVFSAMVKPLLAKYPSVDAKAFEKTLEFGKRVMKGENLLANGVKNIFVAGAKVIPSNMMPRENELEALDKRTKAAAESYEKLSNTADGGGMNTYLPAHGMAMAGALSNAATYINNQRPNPKPAFPFDSKPVASSAQKADFKRTLSIAQQPLVTLQHIKDGTITPKDVATLSAVYPAYYNKMSGQLMQEVIKHVSEGSHVPYKTRLGLSIFLAQPLDSSMTPMGIMTAQPAPAQAPQPPMPGKAPSESSTKGLQKMPGLYQTATQSRQAARSSKS